ncbi:MAG: hypothetical protein M3O71_07630 [Bacteroidota bacterium]|nr:hypothetical protein [Bacteroidota bacterium]
MKTKILQYLALACLLITVFSSCRKESFGGKENSQAGKTYVWITEADASTYTQYFDLFSDVKTIILFTVRRDPASKADLQKAITVKIGLQTDSTTNAGITVLTSSQVSYPTAADIATGGIYASYDGVTPTSTGWTVNFAPGEFAKNIIIKVKGSTLDLSNVYGGVYKITDLGGFSTKVGYDVIAAGIGVKNPWDGIYAFTGTMSDAANGALSHPNNNLGDKAPMQYELRTISATTCVVYDNYINHQVDVIISSGTGLSYYGSLGIVVTFDPATNKVVKMVNYYGQPAGNSRYLQLDDTGVNAYDPKTQTITIKYDMFQPSVTTLPPPYLRTAWDEKWKYIGSR